MTYLLPVLAVLTFAPAIVHAQHPQARQGFGMSVGILPVTYVGVSSTDCTKSPVIRGGSAYLRMGGYSRSSLFKGIELNAWDTNRLWCRTSALSASFVVQWYPKIASGFYLKGGAGIAAGYPPLVIGLSPNLGLGVDWRLTRNFSLSPQINYVRILDTGMDAVQLGVGFTWH